MKDFTDLLYEVDDALSLETCDNIIERFQDDNTKAPPKEQILELKESIDLYISDSKKWNDIDEILLQSLTEHFEKYTEQIARAIGRPLWINEVMDSGYTIKQYQEADYVNWHQDTGFTRDGWNRMLSCIWYLNTIEEGGETEFAFEYKLKPVTGKLIMFPATWNFPYKHLKPIRQSKYIITSFFLTRER